MMRRGALNQSSPRESNPISAAAKRLLQHLERSTRTYRFVRHHAPVGQTPTIEQAITRLSALFILRHSALMSDYRFFDRLRSDAAAERRAIIAGLLADSPAIAPKHFYDPVGCADRKSTRLNSSHP